MIIYSMVSFLCARYVMGRLNPQVLVYSLPLSVRDMGGIVVAFYKLCMFFSKQRQQLGKGGCYFKIFNYAYR